jgi:predicted RNase H-like HicB family nuclease
VDLTVEVHKEGSGYWAHVVDLPGCFAAELSLEELRNALEEAIGLYLWDHPNAVMLSDQELEPGETRIQVFEPFS